MRIGILGVLLLASMAAAADESSVKKLVESKFQGARVTSVARSGYGGLYEVFLDGQIGYTDEQVSFFLIGNLIDTRNNVNVTQQRLRKLTAVNVKDIPLDLAIRKVTGNGKRTLIVFSDPMCPFCQKLEQELARVDNVTLYIMLYPNEQKFKGTTELAKGIWCASDRARAWNDWMQRRIKPAGRAACRDPVERLDQVGGKLGIDTTPTLIFPDGGVIAGVIPAAQIDKLLNEK